MGLDGVEIIVEVEDEFGINIPDADAQRIRTVGELAEYVIQRKQGRAARFGSCSCPTQRTFYAMRRQVVARTQCERREIAPGTSVAAVIPVAARRALWSDFAAADLHVPPLRAHLLLQLLIVPVGVVVGLWAALYIGTFAMFTSMFATVWLWMKLIEAFERELPPAGRTFGDLARESWLRTDSQVPASLPRSFDDQILSRVIVIIAEQMGVARGRLGPDTHWDEIGVG